MLCLLITMMCLPCAVIMADDVPPVWDLLTVTFRKFHSLPRSESEAISKKWEKIGDYCKDGKSPFFGRRYTLNDPATVLIFDIRGHVAGMQMGFKASKSYAEKHVNNKAIIYDPVSEMIHMTAYFTEPSTICSKRDLPLAEGITGDKLVFVAGKNKTLTVPLMEKGIPSTKWVKGRCFPGMGNHYWYNINSALACENMFPFFTLYYQGKLSGFGFLSDEQIPGDRVEHPPSFVVRYFFNWKTMPKCLPKLHHRSTQHVYMRNVPYWGSCSIFGK